MSKISKTMNKVFKVIKPHASEAFSGVAASTDLHLKWNICMEIGITMFASIFIMGLITTLYIESYAIYVVLFLNDIANVVLQVGRQLDLENCSKVPIVKIISSRLLMILFFFGLEEFLDYAIPPIDILIYSSFMSYYLFDLSLVMKNTTFSDRTSYFRDRFWFYCGYGFICTISLYFECYNTFTVAHFVALHSKKVMIKNEKAPKYARWLPHTSTKVPTSFYEFLELGIERELQRNMHKIPYWNELVSSWEQLREELIKYRTSISDEEIPEKEVEIEVVIPENVKRPILVSSDSMISDIPLQGIVQVLPPTFIDEREIKKAQ